VLSLINQLVVLIGRVGKKLKDDGSRAVTVVAQAVPSFQPLASFLFVPLGLRLAG
jgi:hypothetical protein